MVTESLRCEGDVGMVPEPASTSAGDDAVVGLLGEPTPCIRKPDTDHRSYRKVVLENGMCVLLITDPDMKDQDSGEQEGDLDDEDLDGGDEDEGDMEAEVASSGGEEEEEEEEEEGSSTKKAAVAMCVHTGSFSDYEEIPGVSHFLEHMLFMGSEDFPNENEYDSYLSKNGGMSNAYTDTECTNYYFDVQPKGLRGALMRFAGFFNSPLCKKDAVDREVQAVESEFVQALQNNAARLSQLRCHTATEGHVFRKFSWGNFRSLIEQPTQKGHVPRDLLLKYHKSAYSAERMSLVVLGAEDLATLERWVRELFSAVPCGLGPPVSFSGQGKPYEGGWVYALPMTREGHELHVLFQLPCLHRHYESKPDDYISHLIGHEGEGSLLSVLKQKGLVTHVSAGVAHEGYDRSTIGYMFNVTFVLTEKGLRFGRDGFGVVEYLFAYINLVRAAGPQRWIWDEISAASKMRFKFAAEDEAADYVQELAVNLRLYKTEHALEGDYLHATWDPELVQRTLGLLVPKNMRVEVQSLSFEGRAFEREEPWFRVPYSARRLTDEESEALARFTDAPGLSLPPRNKFLPTDFGIRTQDLAPGERSWLDKASAFGCPTPEALLCPPLLVSSSQDTEAWYKHDRFFRTPKLALLCSFEPDDARSTAERCVLLKLATRVLEDSLVETTYLADVADLSTHVYSNGDRLELRLEGFSHKLPTLLTEVLGGMASLEPDGERFEACRETLRRALKNSIFKPSRHAAYLRLLSLQLESWPLENQLEALEGLTAEKCRDFVRGLLSSSRRQVLIHGNATTEEAKSMVAEARSKFSAGPPRGPFVKRLALLKPGQRFVHSALAQNPQEKNSASEVYFQVGEENDSDYAALSLLEQLVYEPFFDQLRTKEQLGYSVSCGVRNTFGALGFCFSVVSAKVSPPEIEERVESFLEQFVETVRGMAEEEWRQNVKSAVEAKHQQDQTLGEEAERHWGQLSSGRYEFFQQLEIAERISSTTKEAFLAWFGRHISAKSDERRALRVRVFGRESEGRGEDQGSYSAGDLMNFREEVAALERKTEPAREGEHPKC